MNNFKSFKEEFFNELLSLSSQVQINDSTLENNFLNLVMAKETIDSTYIEYIQEDFIDFTHMSVLYMSVTVFNAIQDSNFKNEFDKRISDLLNTEYNQENVFENFIESILFLENDINLVLLKKKELVDYDFIFKFFEEYLNLAFYLSLS